MSTQRRMHGGLRDAFPMLSRTVLAIMIVNVAAYVAELLLLRAGSDLPLRLMLVPQDVVTKGYVWQIGTTLLMDNPGDPRPMLSNLLWIFFFGPALEHLWGPRRLLWTYIGCGIAGSVSAVLLGSLSLVPGIGSVFSGVWTSPQVGAGGAALAIAVAFCVANFTRGINLLFLGEVRGSTLLGLILGFEILVALSFGNDQSPSHFGAAAAGAVAALELWRPARLKELLRRRQLLAQKREVERKLARFQVIEGGRKEQGSQRKPPRTDDWVH